MHKPFTAIPYRFTFKPPYKGWLYSPMLVAMLVVGGVTLATPAHAGWWNRQPLSFEQYLAREYTTAAGFEANDATDLSDWRVMRDRAVAVKQGNRVLPLTLDEIRLVRGTAEDITWGRTRLMRVLENPQKVQQYPRAVAKAQVAFDCWALHQQAEPNASHNLYQCERNFRGLIEQLDTPPPVAQVMPEPAPEPVAVVPVKYDVVMTEDILFGWDDATLTPAAKAQLDRLNAALRDEANPTKNIALQGFADRSGTEAYNQKLSERRVQVVANYLGINPADAVRIDLTAYGETNLPVETADGVREPRNRVTKVAVVREATDQTGGQMGGQMNGPLNEQTGYEGYSSTNTPATEQQ